MLRYGNKNDIDKMLRYHKARDMIYLKMFFKDLSPVTDMIILEDINDVRDNYDIIKNYKCERNDNPINEPTMISIEHDYFDSDYIMNKMIKVKEVNRNGVMVLFNTYPDTSYRYMKDAGISVNIRLYEDIVIEAVGRGFDGREVSKGISCHERYRIPWNEINLCKIDNFKSYRIYRISDDDYIDSRRDREIFLKSIGTSDENIDMYLPKKYNDIPNYIWIDIIDKIFRVVYKEARYLEEYKLFDFVISGNTEEKRFCPWSLYDKTR